jgi:glycosyltransferase involved in cell wall biosynthesis
VTGAVELSILMPCLDEAETVGSCVRAARAWLERSGVDGEVLVADNGSTDGSQALAEAEGARVVPIPRRGYGAALLGGIEAARGTYVVMGDSDESYDFGALDPFLAELRDGADLVMGNRFRGGIADGAMPRLHRYLGNPVLSGIGRLFFHIPVGDFHCGLRGFRRDRALELDLRTPGMEFASEMVVKAALAGLDIREVATTLSPDGRSRPPHLRTWSDGWRHLRFLLLFSPRWLFLIPGLIAFVGGLLLTAALLFGPIEIGPFGLDVSALVYAAGATIGGFQAVSFALFTKILAISRGYLPPDDRINRLGGTFRLERGLLLGAFVLAIGLGTAIVSFLRWGDAGWSGLDPGEQLRLVVPAMLGIVLGSSIVLTSFYLSILGMDADIEYTT